MKKYCNFGLDRHMNEIGSKFSDDEQKDDSEGERAKGRGRESALVESSRIAFSLHTHRTSLHAQ